MIFFHLAVGRPHITALCLQPAATEISLSPTLKLTEDNDSLLSEQAKERLG